MPSAPPASVARLEGDRSGTANDGSPWGSGPTTDRSYLSASSSAPTTTVAPTTATSTSGYLGQPALEAEDHGQADQADPQRDAVGLAVGDALDEAGDLADQAVGVDREPEQLGELPHQDRQGDPVHVAVAHRLGQHVGDEPEAQQAGAHVDDPGQERERAGQRDGLVGVARRQGHDGDRDQGRERGVGTEDQDPARPEQGIGDQRDHGRVQPVDGWQPRRLGVAHPGGHQQRGQHEPGDQVAGQPGGLVAQQRTQPRQPLQAVGGRLLRRRGRRLLVDGHPLNAASVVGLLDPSAPCIWFVLPPPGPRPTRSSAQTPSTASSRPDRIACANAW